VARAGRTSGWPFTARIRRGRHLGWPAEEGLAKPVELTAAELKETLARRYGVTPPVVGAADADSMLRHLSLLSESGFYAEE